VSTRSVKLTFDDGGQIYITPNRARQLRRQKAVIVISYQPFVLRSKGNARPDDCVVQRWTEKSGGAWMSGKLLNKRTPRP
jgi:hypothetical protein